MPTPFLLLRAVVAKPLRDKFDHWYSADHLPRAGYGERLAPGVISLR